MAQLILASRRWCKKLFFHAAHKLQTHGARSTLNLFCCALDIIQCFCGLRLFIAHHKALWVLGELTIMSHCVGEGGGYKAKQHRNKRNSAYRGLNRRDFFHPLFRLQIKWKLIHLTSVYSLTPSLICPHAFLIPFEACPRVPSYFVYF